CDQGDVMLEPLKFKDILLERPLPRGFDVFCRPSHLAIITYAVEPKRLAHLIPTRFHLTIVSIEGRERALVSVVPFINEDFTIAAYPFPRLRMAQVNYRAYITDRTTGGRCAWFLETVLDSWSVIFPRHLWQLPWHKGVIEFDFDFDHGTGLYRRYAMRTKSERAAAAVELYQDQDDSVIPPGFPDRETALVYLSHPLCGYFRRRDGRLSRFSIWHPEIILREAKLKHASFAFLDGMNLVPEQEQQRPHSVILGPTSEFTIYLPPAVID
ncbi:MAG: DUF2071 domain-containing protein, partial [Desulfobulbales bacterium]|nr:DUF2071 domain-containing protein [Desulfobulbales bacterium]